MVLSDSKLKEAKFKPVSIVPFEIYNRKPFVNRDHPKMHPEDPRYEMYWLEQAKRCVEGYWGHDYSAKKNLGGYRFMPGNLYFYINMCAIKQEGEGNAEDTLPPNLRDIDWVIFYSFLACEGFSGFSKDEEYTCFRPVKLLEEGRDNEISNVEWMYLERYKTHLKKKDGSYKKYVEAKDYLAKTWDKPMGKAEFLNSALNLVLLSSRRIGKSYSVGCGIILYDFVFNGSRTIDQFINGETSTTTVVGSPVSDKSKELLDKFTFNYERLRKDIGSWEPESESGYPGVFWVDTNGSVKETGDQISNASKLKGSVGFKGVGSKVAHVSYHNNDSAGVGFGARKMVVEEAGLLSNFGGVHRENSAVQIRNRKFGFTVYIGTGGDMEKILGIRDSFLRPRAYDCLPFENKFSKKGGQIGLFVPAYYVNDLMRDENGNTDIQKAFEDELRTRIAKKAESEKAYQGHCISFPIFPGEMFMSASGNKFPTSKIQNRIGELEDGLHEELISAIGELDYMNKEMTKATLRPVMAQERDRQVIFRLGDESSEAAKRDLRSYAIIYEPPIPDLPERSFSNPLYMVFYDPVKDEEGSSLASVIVFKFWDFDKTRISFNIVAEWTGRYDTVEGNHEVAAKFAAYYNCPLCPERNNKDIIRHMNMTNRYDWLQPKPGLAIDGILTQKKNYDVGVYISPSMPKALETYTAEVFNTIIDKKEYISGSEYRTELVTMVDQCPSLGVLDEALIYDVNEGNFDRISALRMVGLIVRQFDKEHDDPDSQMNKEREEELMMQFLESSYHIGQVSPWQ